MHIGWPQGIVLSLLLIHLGIYIAKHGEPRNEKYNVLYAFISVILNLALLWWGGFFK